MAIRAFTYLGVRVTPLIHGKAAAAVRYYTPHQGGTITIRRADGSVAYGHRSFFKYYHAQEWRDDRLTEALYRVGAIDKTTYSAELQAATRRKAAREVADAAEELGTKAAVAGIKLTKAQLRQIVKKAGARR